MREIPIITPKTLSAVASLSEPRFCIGTDVFPSVLTSAQSISSHFCLGTEVITSAQASAHFFLASFSSFGTQGVGTEVLASLLTSAGFCSSLYSANLTLFLFEFDLRVNYKVVALEDSYKSSTHGSSNSKRGLRYGRFGEVAHV
jgi:hypothetical protein